MNRLIAALAAALAFAAGPLVFAQTSYPTRSITMVLPLIASAEITAN